MGPNWSQILRRRVRPPRDRRRDASMDLLNQLIDQPIEPGYAEASGGSRSAGATTGRRRGALIVFGCLLVAGAMIGLSLAQTLRAAPADEQQRLDLVDRIARQEQTVADQRARIGTLTDEIDAAREQALAGDATGARTRDRLERYGEAAQTVDVRGPGLVITVDDAPADAQGTSNRVLDRDLQLLVNGLWLSGAEAIAINGHRLGSRTAIRAAGDAITVDYRSLTRPYRVEAIGDPRNLQSRWVQSSGGVLWNYLKDNYQMRYELTGSDELTLPGSPQAPLERAEVAR
ncbi:DUF881 domain-containing protein [Naumannella cuiyingiana]|uniref:Uncharacterized protein YlxW (UPF0749 family) n=1 Tax=Naumannella cuiyingiana TaxID=1347891 RepID=A0A7Z0DC86_9ACTN|nr:DUF881 domain-containing protein [Naumannella cuiyingiana]NYI72639.1 uncharacterized protein YlxW (UPF0749 family) [Naumannella cuiyingiana]